MRRFTVFMVIIAVLLGNPGVFTYGTENTGSSDGELECKDGICEIKKKIVFEVNNPIMTVGMVKKEIDPGKKTMPLIVNDMVMLPARSLVEAIGGTAEWDPDTRKVTIRIKETTLELWKDSSVSYVNGHTKIMEQPPFIIDGRLMVPLRYVVENIGWKVQWDAKTRRVTITN